MSGGSYGRLVKALYDPWSGLLVSPSIPSYVIPNVTVLKEFRP